MKYMNKNEIFDKDFELKDNENVCDHCGKLDHIDTFRKCGVCKWDICQLCFAAGCGVRR